VGLVDEALEVAAPAEPLVDAEVADGQVTPVDLGGDVADRHELQAGDAQVGQVPEPCDGAVKVTGELGQVQLVDDEILQLRGLPGGFGVAPGVGLVVDGDRRLPTNPELARERIDDPVGDQAIPVLHAVPIHIPAGAAPRRPGRAAAVEWSCAGPVVSVVGVDLML
jgi:hypothetical protein